MQPSNQQERNKAFWNFLLFFCITVGVIVVTMLFSFQVPFKERDMLRKKQTMADNQRLTLLSFSNKMQSTLNMIDSMEQFKNTVLIKGKIDANIKILLGMASSDTTWMQEMLNSAVYSVSALAEAKVDLLEVSDSKNQLLLKDQKITDLSDKLDKCRRDLLKSMSGAGQ